MRKIVCVLVAAVVVSLGALAQDNAAGGGGGGGGGGGRGNRGNFDPAAMRQRMLDGIKTAFGVTDDEWKALQPKVEAVQTASRQGRMGMGGMFGRRGGPGGGGGAAGGAAGGANANAGANAAQPTSDLEKKIQELRTLVENKDADPKAVKDKLKEVRDLRETAKLDLKKAQDSLRELLTPRQEAQALLYGLLD